MDSLYVLELTGGKYYVGKSADVAKRFDQHKSGTGSAWTRLHKPVRILETRPLTNVHDETNVTKDLMKKYGIDNVRGGAYASISLSEGQKSGIEHETRAASDACYKCGKTGHFANRCTAPEEESEDEEEWECDYCDRTFTTKYGCSVHERSCASKQASPQTGACYRCGRAGHYSPECYARTHVNGYALDDDDSPSYRRGGYRGRGRRY